MLSKPDGKPLRLYSLISYEIVILSFSMENKIDTALSIIEFGRNGYNDISGQLTQFLKNKVGWILVRPDMHIAWAGNDTGQLGKAIALLRGEI